MICALCGTPLDATGSRTCSCRRPADVGVIVAARRERRARGLRHITEVAAGMRAGLDVRDALERADERISTGHAYWSIVFEGAGESVKRCERCQALHVHLRDKGNGELWPDERLNCGESYYDHWGHEPPPEIAALAFALPGEVIT